MHFESLGADLEAVHRLDGGLSGRAVVERHESEALGQVGLLVDEHLGRHDVSERHEGRCEIRVGELLRQMVDEQVAALGALDLLSSGLSHGLCQSRVGERRSGERRSELLQGRGCSRCLRRGGQL